MEHGAFKFRTGIPAMKTEDRKKYKKKTQKLH